MRQTPTHSPVRRLAPCALLLALACGGRTGAILDEEPRADDTSAGGAALGVSPDPVGHRGDDGGRAGAPNAAGGTPNGAAGTRGLGGGNSSGGHTASAGGSKAHAEGGASGASMSTSGTGGALSVAGSGATSQGGSAGTGGSGDNCCTEHGTPGCSSPAISQCVCQGTGMYGGDPFCCGGRWDDQCAYEVVLYKCGACTVTAP